MTLFAVVASDGRDNMKEAIEHRFEEHNRLQVGDSLWFVDTDLATTKEVVYFIRSGSSEDSQENEYDVRSFMVLPMKTYFGMHKRAVWDWIMSRGDQ